MSRVHPSGADGSLKGVLGEVVRQGADRHLEQVRFLFQDVAVIICRRVIESQVTELFGDSLITGNDIEFTSARRCLEASQIGIKIRGRREK